MIEPESVRLAFTGTLRHWDSSLFPKDSGYVVPVEDAIRHALGLVLDDTVTVEVSLRPMRPAIDPPGPPYAASAPPGKPPSPSVVAQ